MEKWMKRAVELVAGLIFTGKENPSVIPYLPQKTEISGHEAPYFKRVNPERHGVSSARLLKMIRSLEADKRTNVHAFICLKDGEVICEMTHPGYGINTWHLSHSMSKTVTGMAIGMLVDDGMLSLDDHVVDLLPEYGYKDSGMLEITVRHLLTMTCGVRFAEVGSVTEWSWTEAFLNSSLAFSPGTEFAYNSMNSYVLARIVVKLTGKTLTEFLDERLFVPLHITNRFWEKSYEGIEKGGWGLYLSAESWAKLGYMMLSGGVFEGRRILSEEWVRESLKRHVATPRSVGHFDYGYHTWTSRNDDGSLFNGMLGQNVWVCPKNGIVAVMMSGSGDIFQNSSAFAIVEEHLGAELLSDPSDGRDGGVEHLRCAEKNFMQRRHWIRPSRPKRGLAYRLGLRSIDSYPREWDVLMGQYHFAKNNVGMIPLVVRAMQNNLHCGIESVELMHDGESVFFLYTEAGTSYCLEVGFSEFKETTVNFNGERYIVRVMGEAMEDEDRNTIYKLELVFPELPNTRRIKLSLTDDERLIARFCEIPDESIADTFLGELEGISPRMSSYIGFVERIVGKNTAGRRIREAFAPTLVGARVGSYSYDAVMTEEKEKRRLSDRNARRIDAVVEKLLRDDNGEDERGFIGDIVDKIRLKIPRGVKKIKDTDNHG